MSGFGGRRDGAETRVLAPVDEDKAPKGQEENGYVGGGRRWDGGFGVVPSYVHRNMPYLPHFTEDFLEMMERWEFVETREVRRLKREIHAPVMLSRNSGAVCLEDRWTGEVGEGMGKERLVERLQLHRGR